MYNSECLYSYSLCTKCLMNKQCAFNHEESHEKIVKENEEETRLELKRKRVNERQRAYYHRQKELKKNEEKNKIKKVPKTNAERQREFRQRQREFRQRQAEKSYVNMKRRKLCSNEENVQAKVQSVKMSSTGAKRTKRYIERLKQERPEKYEDQCKRNKERMKDIKEQISKMTPEEAEEQHKKWKMPFTEAEKSKRYRQQLKRDHPEKYEALLRKNAERTKNLRMKKKADLTAADSERNTMVEIKTEIKEENIDIDDNTDMFTRFEAIVEPNESIYPIKTEEYEQTSSLEYSQNQTSSSVHVGSETDYTEIHIKTENPDLLHVGFETDNTEIQIKTEIKEESIDIDDNTDIMFTRFEAAIVEPNESIYPIKTEEFEQTSSLEYSQNQTSSSVHVGSETDYTEIHIKPEIPDLSF